jgi:putative toxin-antitoxin system antitoxin component (TIGR02293 family)
MPEETRQDAPTRTAETEPAPADVPRTMDQRRRAVLDRAVEVLGNEERAERWMQRRLAALGGATPADTIASAEGFQEVMDTLMRIEYTVYS